MQFLRRNVSKTSRNGELIITRGDGNIGTSSSGGGGGSLSGNYLPATQTENGLYIVDLATVKFSGNIYAGGEISAFGQGGGGTTSSGNTEIIDALSSSSVTAALSANQGRVLNDKIITLSGDTYTKAQVDALISGGTSSGNTDLSNYYTKEETYSKTEVDEKISAYTGNYLPANKNDDGSYTVDLEKVTFNGRIVATSDISAFGEGDTPEGIVVDLSNYYTKDQVYNTGETYNKAQIEALISTSNTGGTVDLSDYYTKTQTDSKISSSLSGYATESWVTNKGYLTSSNLNGYATQSWVQNQKYLTGYTLPSNVVYDEDLANYFTKTEVNNKLAGYSTTGHNHHFSALTTTAHTHTISQVTNLQTTLNGKFNTTGGTISGDLYVTGKIIADGEISAFGEGQSGSGGGSLDLSNYYTKSEVYNKSETYTKTQIETLFDTYEANVDLTNYYNKTQIDTKLAGYSPTTHTHDYLPLTGGTMSNQNLVTNLNADLLDGYSGSAYLKKSESGHTHPISAITNLQSSLDGKSGTGHSHSNYSVTSHTHSNYSTTGHTHDDRYFTESEINTKLAGKSDTSHTHSNYSVTSHTHSLSSLSSSAHTHPISSITSLQTTLDGKSGTGHTHDGRYYTESEVDTKLSNKFDKTGGTVSGSITATGNIVANGEVTALSDIRLKKNITPLQSRGKLNPVTYTKDGKQCIGFVAQDVNELYPELVLETQTDEKYLGVNYPQITAVLAAQINELTHTVEKLKKEIKELKNK